MAGTKGRRWKCRSRPCSVCSTWFVPHPRTRKTQKACSAACSRELHRRRSATARRLNADEDREDRLRRRLLVDDALDVSSAGTAGQIRWDRARAAIGLEQAVVIRTSSQELSRWVRALMRAKQGDIAEESTQIPLRGPRAAIGGSGQSP